MSSLPDLPLLHDGDGYVLSLSEHGRDLLLLTLLRYENNENSDPLSLKFFDLDERGRAAVLQQIQRRYPGRSVRV